MAVVMKMARSALGRLVELLIGAPPYAADNRDAGWEIGAEHVKSGQTR